MMVFYGFLWVVRNQPFFFPFETGCLRQAWGSTCSATEILPRGSPSALVFRVGCDMAGVEHANIRAENFWRNGCEQFCGAELLTHGVQLES